jgi:hypothetical protein
MFIKPAVCATVFTAALAVLPAMADCGHSKASQPRGTRLACNTDNGCERSGTTPKQNGGVLTASADRRLMPVYG